jgi:hypothetical protein
MTVPVYVVNFNRFTWTKTLVQKVASLPGFEPVIVDNGSTYGPTLDWYASKPCRIERAANTGERSPWISGVVARGPEPYVVTDPDLDLSSLPNDTLEKLQTILARHPTVTKAGLSIRIDDLPKNALGKVMFDFESQYWKKWDPWGDFVALVDTTFALYRSKQPPPGMPSWTAGGLGFYYAIRASHPYSCRHLPWYVTPETITEEDRAYVRLAGRASNWAKQFREIFGVSI